MKILIAGGDGFCGWPTALYLSKQGHEVTIVDSLIRRKMGEEVKSHSLTPIASLDDRVSKWKELTGKEITIYLGNINSYDFSREVLRQTLPDAYIHLAEQSSGVYSMIDRDHAIYTQENNVIGTLNVIYAIREMVPDCHLIKLGTLGDFRCNYKNNGEETAEFVSSGSREGVQGPPRSMVDLTKVHDRHNLKFACKAWGTRVTVVNLDHVYGLHTPETLLDPLLINRFDYDPFFGTALNRFLIQATIGHPLTIYGAGEDSCGYLNIVDMAICIETAILNPSERGAFRVINPFTEHLSTLDLAQRIQSVGIKEGLEVTMDYLKNPRMEMDSHHFGEVQALPSVQGHHSHFLTEDILSGILKSTMEHKDRVIVENVRSNVVE